MNKAKSSFDFRLMFIPQSQIHSWGCRGPRTYSAGIWSLPSEFEAKKHKCWAEIKKNEHFNVPTSPRGRAFNDTHFPAVCLARMQTHTVSAQVKILSPCWTQKKKMCVSNELRLCTTLMCHWKQRGPCASNFRAVVPLALGSDIPLNVYNGMCGHACTMLACMHTYAMP